MRETVQHLITEPSANKNNRRIWFIPVKNLCYREKDVTHTFYLFTTNQRRIGSKGPNPSAKCNSTLHCNSNPHSIHIVQECPLVKQLV